VTFVGLGRKGSTGQAVRAVQDQINFRNNKNGHTLAWVSWISASKVMPYPFAACGHTGPVGMSAGTVTA
jgi:hypothetical protein